jgi:hypothetical protein
MFQGKKKTLTQVLQVLVAIGLLPLSLVGAGGIWFSVLSQRDELKRSTLEISRALASAIEAQLDAEAAAVAAIGRSPSLSERDYAAFYAYAKTEVNVRPGWSGMVLTGRDGRVIFRTSKPFGEPDVQVVDPDSLALSAASGRVVVGALTKGPGGRFAFPVRVPAVADGRMTHVLTAVVSPDWALELLRKQNVPQEWVISVFDRNLRRVARSKDHEATVGGLPTPDLAKLFRAETAERAVGVSRNLEGQETFTGVCAHQAARLDRGGRRAHSHRERRTDAWLSFVCDRHHAVGAGLCAAGTSPCASNRAGGPFGQRQRHFAGGKGALWRRPAATLRNWTRWPRHSAAHRFG